MLPIASNKNKNGFTLIELMVAIVILTIATMGLLQALTRYIQINIDNEMRNEAMRITEARMEVLRGLTFNDTTDQLTPDDGTAVPNSAQLPTTVSSYIRKILVPFAVQTTISQLSCHSGLVPPCASNNSNSKAAQVLVTWTINGMQHQHSAATVLTREW